jgi:hypothetical protein
VGNETGINTRRVIVPAVNVEGDQRDDEPCIIYQVQRVFISNNKTAYFSSMSGYKGLPKKNDSLGLGKPSLLVLATRCRMLFTLKRFRFNERKDRKI